jgi:hypothetical protein
VQEKLLGAGLTPPWTQRGALFLGLILLSADGVLNLVALALGGQLSVTDGLAGRLP